MSPISPTGKMADTSKNGLLLGGGICHITATQAEVKKFLLAYVISSACAKECLIAAGINVKLKMKFAIE